MKWPAWIAASMLLAAAGQAQDIKIDQASAHDVLEARWVAVVAYSGSDVPAENPQENQRAIRDVQSALMKWGRYGVTPEPSQADLIITVRKGRAGGTTVSGTRNPSPVILDPGGGGVTIGVHKGQPPPLSRGDTTDSRPSVGAQVGPAEDMLEVYRGRTKYPLDEPPIWRYRAKDGLKAPKMEAVAKFRKAVEEAEKKRP